LPVPLCLCTLLCQAPSITALLPLSLHDALPISRDGRRPRAPARLPVLHSFGRGAVGPSTGFLRRLQAHLEPRAALRPVEHCDLSDRKSTRLNSSHGSISYAVFCLKKNKISITRK